jgi:SOS-response transcriptional repressor LexA
VFLTQSGVWESFMRVKKTKIITIPKLISSVKCGYEETFSDGNAEMVDFVVPEDFKDNISGYFAADASGDSMYPIIFDGDTVVIDKNYNGIYKRFRNEISNRNK